MGFIQIKITGFYEKNSFSVMQNEYFAPYIGMKNKNIKLLAFFVSALQIVTGLLVTSCGDICPSGYTLELPAASDAWVSLLGEPYWQIEWYDSGGNKKTANHLPNDGSLEIELPVTITTPVTAWPHWPVYNLTPGLFKPAGALFPFDAKGSSLCLSWEAGVDAVFYKELTEPAGKEFINNSNYTKIPANFDWPRFRLLLKEEKINVSVRENPWLVNWQYVAEKTISGNFDSRRLVPETAKQTPVPFNIIEQITNWTCLWYGTSPFDKPVSFAEGETPVFNIRSGINIWISQEGILRVNGNSWVFNNFNNGK